MLTVVTLLFLTGLFEQLPEATLAAVVIAAVIELVDIARAAPALPRLRRAAPDATASPRGPDFIAAVAAMLGVLVFDTLPGLFIGIGVSLLLLLYRASRPHVAVLGQRARRPRPVRRRRAPPGERADAGHRRRCASSPGCSSPTPTTCATRSEARRRAARRAVVLDAGDRSPFIDVTAADMLAQLADDLERRGVDLLIAHDVGQVRDVLRRSGAAVEPKRVYPGLQEAIEAARATSRS